MRQKVGISWTRRSVLALSLLGLLTDVSCSVKKLAVNSMGKALAESSSVYASDNDLELVRQAMPFGLKTVEALVAQAPRSRDLLVTAASGFTQYAHAFVEMDAFEVEESDSARARELRLRAKNLYLRARDYGLRALDLPQAGWSRGLEQDPAATLARFKEEHVPELYWTAVSWAGAIAADKQAMDLIGDLHVVEAMMRRCLDLNESFDHGAIHEFLVTFEGSRSQAMGGSPERARRHFQRARELSGGKKVSLLVSLAENVSVAEQKREEFEKLLDEALAFDVSSAPEFRLANLIAQKRAGLLKARLENFFIEE